MPGALKVFSVEVLILQSKHSSLTADSAFNSIPLHSISNAI